MTKQKTYKVSFEVTTDPLYLVNIESFFKERVFGAWEIPGRLDSNSFKIVTKK